MLAVLTSLKPKLWALLGAVLAFLALLGRNRWLQQQRDNARYERDKAKYRAKVAEAGLERKAETEEREAEIDSEWSDVERVANESIDDIPEFLRNRRNANGGK